MLSIHYFASIRESLGLDAEQFSSQVTTVAELVDALVLAHGEGYAKVLRAKRVLVAVNQEVATMQTAIGDGDEVAFFPPVTGG